jgi:phage-related protein
VDDLLRAIKSAVFVGSSRRDLQAFPSPVRREIGQALFEAQLGDHPVRAKPLKGFGSGLLEIRDNHDGDAPFTSYASRVCCTSSTRSRKSPPKGLLPRSVTSI